MHLQIETKAYNAKTLGRPWAAVLDYTASANRPDYAWLQWVGAAGQAGEFQTHAPPGAVIATGQRNMRNHRGATAYYLVDEVGYTMTTQAVEALRHWRRFQAAEPAPAAAEPIPMNARDLANAIWAIHAEVGKWALTMGDRIDQADAIRRQLDLTDLANWVHDHDHDRRAEEADSEDAHNY